MERRKFPRQDVQESALRATLILTGDSLIRQDSTRTFEVEAHPIDVSCGGIGLSLQVESNWTPFSLQKHLVFFLENGTERKSLKGRIVRIERQRGHKSQNSQILGIEFDGPRRDLDEFVMDEEITVLS